MARALLFLAVVGVVTPRHASAFFCRYPIQRLTGLAHLGDGFVRLDLGVRLRGAECEVTIEGGQFRCRRIGLHALGGTFTRPARGRCPGTRGTIVTGSYSPRRSGERIADIVIETDLETGGTCTLSGLSLMTTLGGPLPSVLGTLRCKSSAGETTAEGEVELLRRPLPQLTTPDAD